jgi:nucleotide-binding universal stress UspA family protein
MPTIVVGVDGSDPAWAALRFAIEEAKLRGAQLRAICAWELPVAHWGELPPPEETFDRFRSEAEEVLGRAAAIVEKEAPSLECDRLALEGAPGRVLLEHSSDAILLVVGSRGRGAVAGLILGSVSQEVVQNAACPVVVVPHKGSSE